MNGKAIVIGGSIAGLAAANVLSRHFNHVTILERDVYPIGEKERAGVPQARHLHALLMKGLKLFQQYFPSLERQMDSLDVQKVTPGLDFHIMYPEGWSPIVDSGVYGRPCTRILLESFLRSDIRRNPAISMIEDCSVQELISDHTQSGIAGVRVVCNGSKTLDLTADFIVDASGRNSRAPKWLEHLGYGSAEEIVVDARWGYAARYLRRIGELPAVKLGAFIMQSAPDVTRLGIVLPVEGGRWLVNLAGVMADYPPGDEEGFLEFARTLRSPLIYNLLRYSEPVSPIAVYRRTDNRLRCFERMHRWPERFVVMGDAICAFNPVYGQGMSVAALQAEALDQALQKSKSLNHFSQRFQKKLSKLVKGPWMLAIGQDLHWPDTIGDRPKLAMRMMLRYVDEIISLLPANPELFSTFQQVAHMMKEPSALFRPKYIWKVAQSMLQKRRLRAVRKVSDRKREAFEGVA